MLTYMHRRRLAKETEDLATGSLGDASQVSIHVEFALHREVRRALQDD
jgi:hypothetical protein